MEVYKCPVLDEWGVYEQDFSGKYDPRHYDTLPDMVKHLRDDNGWTDKEVADWQETAQPV